jgi:hypothetical protein
MNLIFLLSDKCADFQVLFSDMQINAGLAVAICPCSTGQALIY